MIVLIMKLHKLMKIVILYGQKIIQVLKNLIIIYHTTVSLKPKTPPSVEPDGGMVELRRVELLSEGSQARPSPSAVCGSDFPRADAHRQESARSSFMLRTHGKA